MIYLVVLISQFWMALFDLLIHIFRCCFTVPRQPRSCEISVNWSVPKNTQTQHTAGSWCILLYASQLVDDMPVIYRIMYVLAWRTVYALTRGLFWCLNTKITLEWAHKQFVHTLFYCLHVITNPSMKLKTRIFACHPRVSLARFTFCWWRHNRLAMTSQWPDNCDANTWQVISNSLDIDFIRDDINGRSCKNEWIIEFIIPLQWHNMSVMTFQIIGALVGFFVCLILCFIFQ